MARTVGYGRVVRRALNLTRPHAVAISLGVLLMISLPAAMLNWAIPKATAAMPIVRVLGPVGAGYAVSGAHQLILSVFQSTFTAWVAAVLVGQTKGELTLRPWALWGAVARRIGPIIATGLIAFSGYLFGLILLVAPGVMLGLAWQVAVPAAMVEGLSPAEALARSASLTRGRRWSLFGLTLIAMLPIVMLNYVAGVLGVALMGGAVPFGVGMTAPLVLFVIKPLVAAPAVVILAAGAASIYIELVDLKQGGLGSSVAEVFA